MYHRRYEKVFLMLRQETAGYASGKRPPWGSCIMELKNGKGKLSFSVQGLRPLCYAAYALAGEESIFCGELRPQGKEGRAELQWDFDPDAVGRGQRAEDFHTVLLLAEDGGASVPLAAYFGEKRDWRAFFHPQERVQVKREEQKEKEEKQEKEEKEEKEEKAEEKPILAAAEKPVLRAAEQTGQTGYHGSFRGLLAKFRQELEALEETGVLSAEETAHIRAVGQEDKGKTEQAEETEQTEKDRQALFAKNKEWEPFGDGVLWKCLFLEELTLLAEIPIKWQREFFFLLPYRRYHHLIFRQEENGFWLGVPEAYDAAEDAEALRFGFQEFRRVEGDWGYRLAFLEQES